jgi:PKD repeat protein
MKHNSISKILPFFLFNMICTGQMFGGGITDVGVPYILSPAAGDFGLSPITISVYNYGDVIVYDIPVHWMADGGSILSEITAGPILPGDSIVYTFPTDIDVFGGMSMCAWTSLDGDDIYDNDSSCSNLVFFAPPLVELGPDTSGCEGYMLDAGNPGMFYLWSTGEITQTKIVNESNVYWVEVTNEVGVTASDSIYIDIDPLPIADFDFVLSGLTATFTNLSSEAEYFNWDFGDGFTSYEENPTHNYAVEDEYIASLEIWNSCETSYTSKSLYFLSISVKEIAGINIYPNPAFEELIVEKQNSSVMRYSISTISGIEIKSGETESENKIDIRDLEKGVYFIEIISEDNIIARKQFIKMQE